MLTKGLSAPLPSLRKIFFVMGWFKSKPRFTLAFFDSLFGGDDIALKIIFLKNLKKVLRRSVFFQIKKDESFELIFKSDLQRPVSPRLQWRRPGHDIFNGPV